MEQKEVTAKVAIAQFFRLDSETLKEVYEQVKALSETDITELAPACAEALGVTLKQ